MKYRIAISVALMVSSASAATKVTFGPDGACLVNGKPFFPIGCWIYNLSPDVAADLHEHRFNTVLGNGLNPADLPLVEKHKLMMIPMATDAWLAAGKASDSLLAWYLLDEPEEHNQTPQDVRKIYDAFKPKDADHPLGITHNQSIGPSKYAGSCDFTMTDIYPVTRDRIDRFPLSCVGANIDAARAAHTPNWTNIAIIQAFGGPDTDGGIWAQPLPHEVRFMTFDALIHRANGILYFSYWPRAPQTWASIATLNRDIERLVPWLLAPGEESTAKSSDPAVEVRARKLKSGAWMILAANTTCEAKDVTLEVKTLGDAALRMPFDHLSPRAKDGQWRAHFGAYEEHVYLEGPDPDWP